MPLVTHIVHLRTKILTCFKWLSVTKHDFARFCARFVFPLRNLAQNLARNLARKSCDRTGLSIRVAAAIEGEGNHSTSVISRLGLVGGGGAVVMV